MKMDRAFFTWSSLGCAAVLCLTSVAAAQESRPFSAKASALPFPPDAREVELDATFDDIDFSSASSLGALVDFYRREMTARGWTEDTDEAEVEDDSVSLTFTHDDAKVTIDLDQGSDDVDVSFECDEIDFDGADDPAALAAAGVPQPRAYVFLQKDIPRPEGVQDVAFKGGDACHFKSTTALQPAFDFFGKALKSAGFKESRKPIITGDRRYTEFKRGPVTVGVNIFTDPVGSRIILDYESTAKEAVVAPLADVKLATTPGETPDPADEPARQSTASANVDVTRNSGSVTFTLGAEKYTFQHVAAFRTKEDSEDITRLVFSERPIPLQKMQALLAKDDDFSFHDLYESGTPGHLTLQLSDFNQFYFYSGGTNISSSVEKNECEFTLEDGRVRGTVKMAEAKEFFDDKYLLNATFDAGIMTPTTKLGASAGPDKLAKGEAPVADSGPLLPEGVESSTSEGTPYCKTTTATVSADLPAVAAFYREQMAAQGWQEKGDANDAQPKRLTFSKANEGAMTISLKSVGERTELAIVSRDDAKAKADGMLPDAGKGRIVLGNAAEKDAVIMIGKQPYPLKAGQGAEDKKDALNYSVAPGKYPLTIKGSGRTAQQTSVTIGRGETWGVVVLPTGDSFIAKIYWTDEGQAAK